MNEKDDVDERLKSVRRQSRVRAEGERFGSERGEGASTHFDGERRVRKCHQEEPLAAADHYGGTLECTIRHSERKASRALCNDCRAVESPKLK